jgi:methionyl-tRNA formyltransferase
MANSIVGFEITKWLIEAYKNDILCVVTPSACDINRLSNENNVKNFIFTSEADFILYFKENQLHPDIGLLAWWPNIISPQIIGVPNNGFINTHPSLLPYNRGKHYNFWAIVEQAPLGVTLHFVDKGIDSGDIIAQSAISYAWEDTGETLYNKAIKAMINLVQSVYPSIRAGKYVTRKQVSSIGSFHKSDELEAVCKIDLDKMYSARELFNLLRARTFSGHPPCYFYDRGERFSVIINIKRDNNER